MRAPAPLKPGSRIAVIAPSSAFPRERFLPGLAWALSRYEVQVSPSIFAREAYLAGSDARRAEELQAALDNPDVRAIWAARGGYGATRLLERLDWSKFDRSPKWLIGFSDITALHLRAQALNVCSVHGPNVSGIREASPLEQLQMHRILEGAASDFTSREFEALVPGPEVEGILFGGNLSLVCAEAAAGRLAPPDDAIWVLEDVSERPYRVDRMLTSIAPYLARARAILFGDFSECTPGPDGATLENVLERMQATCPVYRCNWFGHGKRNMPMVLGSHAKLGASGLFLRWR